MQIYKPNRVQSLLARWGKIKPYVPPPWTPPPIGQPMGFANYGITYSEPVVVVAPQQIAIQTGQPIGFANYGITYSQPIN